MIDTHYYYKIDKDCTPYRLDFSLTGCADLSRIVHLDNVEVPMVSNMSTVVKEP